jgi:putrescine transport system ATP-binding protein
MTLHISNVSKRYGNNWALRDVSFEAEPGEVLALLGPTASGKSTLINILSGREKPSTAASQLGIDGRMITTFPEGRSSKWFSAFRRAQSSNLRDQIGSALTEATEILLLDDPLASADRELRMEMLTAVREATSKRNLTVLYSTSDFETAALIGDKVAVLSGGFIVQSGSPMEIYETPVSTAVARITGRCNIITARRLTSTKFEVPEFQTIAGGHRLFAEHAGISKLGAINRDVSLMIRPENISMSIGASFPEDNVLKAVVEDINYLGPLTLIYLDANGLKLQAAVPRVVGLEAGQECVIGLPPERVRILKD